MNEYLTIAIIAILGAMSPGPDFAVVTKNAITYSRQAGYHTSFGIFSGLILQSTWCILGLALIIQQSVFLLSILKYAGSIYLIYLGIKSLLSQSKQKFTTTHKKNDIKKFQAWREGFLVNILNPKCILFMITVFTVVVKPHTSITTQIIYGLELAGLGYIWFITLSYLLTHGKINKGFTKIQNIFVKLLGLFLIFLGIHIAFFYHMH